MQPSKACFTKKEFANDLHKHFRGFLSSVTPASFNQTEAFPVRYILLSNGKFNGKPIGCEWLMKIPLNGIFILLLSV